MFSDVLLVLLYIYNVNIHKWKSNRVKCMTSRVWHIAPKAAVISSYLMCTTKLVKPFPNFILINAIEIYCSPLHNTKITVIFSHIMFRTWDKGKKIHLQGYAATSFFKFKTNCGFVKEYFQVWFKLKTFSNCYNRIIVAQLYQKNVANVWFSFVRSRMQSAELLTLVKCMLHWHI